MHLSEFEFGRNCTKLYALEIDYVMLAAPGSHNLVVLATLESCDSVVLEAPWSPMHGGDAPFPILDQLPGYGSI